MKVRLALLASVSVAWALLSPQPCARRAVALGATKTKKGQGEKSLRRAYYETVAGVKYDKAVLEACRGFVATSGALDLSSAKTTWALIADGNRHARVGNQYDARRTPQYREDAAYARKVAEQENEDVGDRDIAYEDRDPY